MDYLVSILLLALAVAVPVILERLVALGKLSWGAGWIDALALRLLRSGGAMLIISYVIAFIGTGQVRILMTGLQLFVLTVFIWLPVTLVAFFIFGRKKPESDKTDAT